MRPRVYLLRGSPRSSPQAVLSAVLAAGDGAFASHTTAARLWGLPIDSAPEIELTIPLERRVRIDGVVAHRSGTLSERDVSGLGPIPVTSPARTLVDLSSALSVEQLGRALDDGLRRRILSLTAMHAVSKRFVAISPGRSPKRLAAVLETRTPGYDPGDSELETHVWEVVRDAGLPVPLRRYQVRVGTRTLTLDLAYPEPRIAIEVDGFGPHGTRTAFDVDRIRQNALVLAGWTILRFTSRSTDDEIVATVANALFGHSATPGVAE